MTVSESPCSGHGSGAQFVSQAELLSTQTRSKLKYCRLTSRGLSASASVGSTSSATTRRLFTTTNKVKLIDYIDHCNVYARRSSHVKYLNVCSTLSNSEIRQQNTSVKVV